MSTTAKNVNSNPMRVITGKDTRWSYANAAIMLHLRSWSKPETRKRIPIYGQQMSTRFARR